MGHQLFSIGRICDVLGAPLHRVRYAIKSRAVKSVARVGNTHCYDQDGLARIRAALVEIERGKEPAGAAATEAAAVTAGA